MIIEHQQLWEILSVAGEAIQDRLINQELRNKKKVRVARRELLKALRAVKRMSVDLQVNLHRIFVKSENSTHTFISERIIPCGQDTKYSACLDVYVLYGERLNGVRAIQKGDIDVFFSEGDRNCEGDDSKSAKSAEVSTDADMVRERDCLTSVKETKKLLRQFGLSYGS